MTIEEEIDYNIRGATADAKKYNTPVVIVDSEVLNEYEFRLNWCTDDARTILYPDHHQQFWKIICRIHPNGHIDSLNEWPTQEDEK